MRQQYRSDDKSPKKALHPYVVVNWVTTKLPHAPKGSSPQSQPLRVEKIIGQWRYLLSDGQVWNARRMSRLFPAEQGDDFLMDWYSLDILEMPIPQGGGGEIGPTILVPIQLPAEPRRSGQNMRKPDRLGYD